MFTFIRGARAMTAACVAAVTFCGTSVTATADPTDNQANNDKLFAQLSGGYTPADCQTGKQYAEDPFLARLGCGRNSRPGGPNAATYSLYANVSDLKKAFSLYGAPFPCPGTTRSGTDRLARWNGEVCTRLLPSREPVHADMDQGCGSDGGERGGPRPRLLVCLVAHRPLNGFAVGTDRLGQPREASARTSWSTSAVVE